MKTCNCNTNTKIPILEEDVFPSCPPERDEIFIYLREFEDTYKLYGYTHTKNEFRLDDLELLTFAVQGVTKMTYDGDYERTFNVIREDLDVYSKQEVTDLLSSAGIIVINSLNSDSTTAALSAAKGKELQQNKVDKESGKELSSNDFTNDYKTKLDSIQSGAQSNQPLKTVNHISLYASGSDTNIDIAKGDYTSIIFRQSETQPPTPTGTNPVPSGWTTNITSSTGTWWMSSSLVNGQTGQASTWSVPIRIVGTNGNSITYVFKQSDTRPATPTGTAPIPSGWADAPTAVGKWWMSKATVSGQTGLVIGSWSVPVQTTAEDGIDGNYTDFKYAANSSTTVPPTLNNSVRNPPGWSDYPPALTSTTYLWMTQATIVEDSLSGTWSVPVRISGENGKDGQWTSFVFRQSETQPATPTGTAVIPSGWSDAPSGTGTWWMSKSLINYLGQALEWTEPVRVTGNDGPQGVPGTPGADGIVYYTWIRYADTETGGGISNDPTGKEYIGFAYNKTTATESNNPLDYRWSLIKGTDGQPGAPGSNTYTWIKYSDYADGTGMYDLPTSNTQYIGIAVNKTTAVESTNKADYTWSKFKGDNGNWTSYAFKQQSDQPATPTDTTIIPSGWSDRPTSTGKWWMIKATISGSSNTVIGTWSTPVQVTGEDGPQGVPGTPGADGIVYYTWIRYADSAAGAGISNDPTGKSYIGFAYNKTTATESNVPGDYTWSLIKGTDGQPGAPGSNTYTWIKYADVADGTGMYDIPTDSTKYIGIAVNKTTATESTNKADYTWSKFKGEDGETPYVIYLTNEAVTVPATSAGVVVGAMPTTTAIVYVGSSVDTGWTFSGSFTGCTGSVNSSTGVVTITSVDLDLANVTISASKASNPTFQKLFTISKARAGSDGREVSVFQVDPSVTVVKKSNTGVLTPTSVSCNVLEITPSGVATLGKTKKVRFIRDWANGNTTNIGNHWVEVQAFNAAGTNVALNKSVVSSTGVSTPIPTNGSLDVNDWYGLDLGSQYIEVDLGSVQEIDYIKSYRYWADDRTYYGTKIEISEDGKVWYTVFDSAVDGTYKESSTGMSFSTTRVLKYQLSNGSITNYTAAVAIGSATWVDFILYNANASAILDQQRVPVVSDGLDGSNGSDGSDGQYTVYQFAKNTSLVTAPSTGWATTPPSLSSGEYLWMRSGVVIPPASTPSTWTTAVRISGENGSDGADGTYVIYQYAKNTSATTAPSTGWSSTPPSISSGEYLWMRMGVVTPPATTPSSWSVPVRISGENGQTGEVGAMLVFMGFWNDSTEYTGTPSLRHIVRVDSGTTTYYIAKTTAGTFTGNLPTDTSKWEVFEANYKSVATEVLFAESANIGGWIFYKTNPGTPSEQQYLRSQNGTAVLNGTTGYVKFTSGNIGGFIVDVQGLKSPVGMNNSQIILSAGGRIFTLKQGTGSAESGLEMGFTGAEGSGKPYLTLYEKDYSIILTSLGLLGPSNSGFFVNVPEITTESLNLHNIASSDPHIVGRVYRDSSYNLKLSKG